MQRIQILDGWRALSILLVLAGHLFPMGPKAWAMNAAVASTGMAIFFTLSGFLITQFLLHRTDIPDFLRRRFFRIVPLAWLAMTALVIANGASVDAAFANFFFLANLPPQQLMEGGGHLWSLCVEMQFYVGVALLVALAGRRGLYALPVLCIAVTSLRIAEGQHLNIVTWFRLDEILAGASLALIYANEALAERLRRLPVVTPLLLLPLLLASAHEFAGPLNYVRPYLAAAAVGTSIFSAPRLMRSLFCSRPAAYVADTSYALYVFHGMFVATWLGTGDTLVKYAKRPLLLLATFAAAHMSTFWLERPLQRLGKRLGAAKTEPVRAA